MFKQLPTKTLWAAITLAMGKVYGIVALLLAFNHSTYTYAGYALTIAGVFIVTSIILAYKQFAYECSQPYVASECVTNK